MTCLRREKSNNARAGPLFYLNFARSGHRVPPRLRHRGLRREAPTPAPAEPSPCASLRLQVRGRATLSRVTPGEPARQELHTPAGFHLPPRQRDPHRAPALPGLNPLPLVCTSTGTLRRGLSPGARERRCAQCHTTHSAPLPSPSPGAPNSRRPRRLP